MKFMYVLKQEKKRLGFELILALMAIIYQNVYTFGLFIVYSIIYGLYLIKQFPDYYYIPVFTGEAFILEEHEEVPIQKDAMKYIIYKR